MKKREIPVMNVGISLIILIFMNICLSAFAVLSLQNALSDYSLSKKTATHTAQYYKAVNKVQEQLAQKNTELRKQWETEQKTVTSKTQSKQKDTTVSQDIKTTQKNTKTTRQNTQKEKNQTQKSKSSKQSKTIPSELAITETVSKRQQLVVTLQLDKTGTYPQYYIEKWQLCSPEDWQADESLDVYKSGQ